jgi:hypothetical protein
LSGAATLALRIRSTRLPIPSLLNSDAVAVAHITNSGYKCLGARKRGLGARFCVGTVMDNKPDWPRRLLWFFAVVWAVLAVAAVAQCVVPPAP